MFHLLQSNSSQRSLSVLSVCAMAMLGSPAMANNSTAEVNHTEVVQQKAKSVIVTVVDPNNEPVVGATVMVRSSKTGGVTNIDGQCTINADAGDVVKVSFVGYTDQTATVGKSGSLRVILRENQELLDEVVVVGYGTMRKSDLTGSSSTTKGSDILKV